VFELKSEPRHLGALSVLAVLLLCSLAGCSRGPSSEDIAEASKACERFYVDERLPLWHTEPKAVDSWTKEGKIVIELALKQNSSSTSYTPRLCVYDAEGGKLSLPAAINQNRWEK
jgi:hypothetical protein